MFWWIQLHVTSDTPCFFGPYIGITPAPCSRQAHLDGQVQMVLLADGLTAQLKVMAKPLVWKMGKNLVVVLQSPPNMRPGILGLD